MKNWVLVLMGAVHASTMPQKTMRPESHLRAPKWAHSMVEGICMEA